MNVTIISFLLDLTDIEGYISFISSPRKSKKNVDFFELDINCEAKTIRGVCYDTDRLPFLQKFKEDEKSCCMLNVENSSGDIIISDNTVIKSKDVNFDYVTRELKIVTLAEIVNECPVYSRVSVIGKLFSVAPAALSAKKAQPFRECKISDISNVTRTITFFENKHITSIQEGQVYKITNVVVSKYDGKKVLKVCENSTLSEVEDPGIEIKKSVLAEPNKDINGVITMIDLESIKPRFCCKFCDKSIHINNHGLFQCCSNVFIEKEIVKKDDVTFTIRGESCTCLLYTSPSPRDS